MKNNMKKIISFMVLGVVFLASGNIAQASWNTYPSDCPLALTIGNRDTREGVQNGPNGCWTKTSISARPGEVINVAVYYDNTNANNAGNTVIRLTQSPNGSMTTTNSTYSFSGTLSSNAGSLNLSQVTANLSSSQTLTFSQAAWYRAPFSSSSLTQSAIPGGQTGYEAFNGGLSLGTIPRGEWGTVLFSFVVGTNGQNNNNSCDTNINASRTSVNTGESVVISWDSYNCTSAYVSGPGLSTSSQNGSQTVYPSVGSNTYTITAYNSNGSTRTDSVTVYVNQNQPPVYVNCAVTTLATNVGTTYATLNGLVNAYGGNSYFEYGTTVDMTLRTPSRSMGGNTNFNETLTGLSPYTIYYFRLVSDCGGSISRGVTQIFRTVGNTQTVIQGTTVVGTASPIMLKIENRYQFIGRGDAIEYAVTYKNIGKSTLIRPILQVIVPKGIVLTNATRGSYVEDTNTLTAPLENLLPGTGGVIYVQGRVDSLPTDTAQIVTTAVLVYTNPNGAQENAIAYVLNNPKDGNNSLLGAAALFGGLGSLSLVGWLLLIIAIMALVLLARKLSQKAGPAREAQAPNTLPSQYNNHF